MLQVNLLDEAWAAALSLPVDLRKILADFVDLIEREPHTGELYLPPDSDLRTAALADGQLLVIWLVLEDQDQVEVVRIMWSGGAGW